MTADSEQISRQALAAVETRRGSGAASGIEVNAARIAVGRATRERAEAEARRVTAVGRLLALLGMDAEEGLQIGGKLHDTAAVPRDVKAQVELALQRRPDLSAARRELDAARTEAKLAAREALPSPRVGVSFGREEDANFIRGSVGFELPLFQRSQAARGVASARVERASRIVEAIERTVRTEVVVAAERLRAASAATTAFGSETLGALAENLELITEAYRAGKLDFFQLLVIQREALDARTSYLNALEELAAAEAELARATGSIE